MRLVGLGPKSGSRHVCFIIAKSRAIQGDKGVNDAGGPAEAGGLTTSSLPLLDRGLRDTQVERAQKSLEFMPRKESFLAGFCEMFVM